MTRQQAPPRPVGRAAVEPCPERSRRNGPGIHLEQIAGLAPDVFTAEVMQAIADDLAQLSPVAASDLPEPPKLSLWQRLLARLASWRARRASQ